jgi:hypothetical protein
MAGQNLLQPMELRVPAVVMVLFTSDLATAGGTVAAHGDLEAPRPPLRPDAAAKEAAAAGAAAISGTLCSDAANWVHSMISSLFDALKVAGSSDPLLAFFGTIWNFIVDRLHAFVEGVITSVTDLILGSVRSIAAGIAAVSMQIASVLPYAVTVDTSGGNTSIPAYFKLTTESLPGQFTASVSAGDLPDWPDVLKDCARVAGVALPDFRSKNVPITWGQVQAPGDPLLAGTGTPSTTTDDAGQAVWMFSTSVDPGDANGDLRNQEDSLPVAVHRPELDRIRAALVNALLGFVPQILRAKVGEFMAPTLDTFQANLNKLLDAPGTGHVWLDYHDKVPPTPVPSLTPAPSSACSTSLPPGTYQGTFTTDSTTTVPPGVVDLGESGTTVLHGTGPLTVTVNADGSLGGSFDVVIQQHQTFEGMSPGSEDTTMNEHGQGVSGTLCNLTLTFASATTTDCHSTGYATCGAIGITIPLKGVVPPLPLGAPTSSSGGQLTWKLSTSEPFDAGFGGLSGTVDSTIVVTLATH